MAAGQLHMLRQLPKHKLTPVLWLSSQLINVSGGSVSLSYREVRMDYRGEKELTVVTRWRKVGKLARGQSPLYTRQ